MARVGRSRWAFLSGWKRTAKLYAKSTIGMIGLIIIIFFVVLAVFAPQLGPNNPVVAPTGSAPLPATPPPALLSPPAWATVLPGYQNLVVTSTPIPPTDLNTQAALAAWKMSGQNYTVTISSEAPGAADGYTAYAGSMLLNASIVPNETIASSSHPNARLPYGQVFFSMSRSFTFDAKAGEVPFTFHVEALLEPLTMVNVSDIYLNFIISGPSGNFSLSSVNTPNLQPQVEIDPTLLPPGGKTNSSSSYWEQLDVNSELLPGSDIPKLNLGNASSIIFTKTGTYTLTMQLQGVPCQSTNSSAYSVEYPESPASCDPVANSSISMLITTATFHVVGGAYGLLGTDALGRDLWSEFVWGSQISLLIGILSGVGAVALGTLAGLAAGYVGGMGDEIIMRITDFVLVLPFLPFLIICVFIIERSPGALASIYWWIILLFIIISWPAIARIIRSQVLTVKERAYVEASRAVGGGTWHIIRKHILPNVMGLVYSQVALNVAGFILLEAALDFLSVSIHSIYTMTWGIMLTQALPFAVSDASASYVWWWFLPPGIAIAALSLAFVLVGFALDSVFNPRLRAR